MKVSMPLYSKRTRLDHKYRLDKIEKAVSKARFLGYNLFHEIRIVFCLLLENIFFDKGALSSTQ